MKLNELYLDECLWCILDEDNCRMAIDDYVLKKYGDREVKGIYADHQVFTDNQDRQWNTVVGIVELKEKADEVIKDCKLQ